MINSQDEKRSFPYFIVIWFGDFISTVGSGLTAFVLGIYAFQITKQATASSMVVLFTFLPAFLLRPIGGVIADRIDRGFLMIFGNLGSALGIGLIILLMTIAPHNLLMIYPGIAVSSVFFALQNPAFKALVSDFVPKELYAKAGGLMQLSNSAQFLVAPIIAGYLMGTMAVRYILYIDVATFLVAVVAILIVKCKFKLNIRPIKKSHSSFFKEIVEGFTAITDNRGVLLLLILLSLILFYVGLFQSLLTPMALSFTNAKALGVSQSTCAVGMLVSSFIVGVFGIRRNYSKILSISLCIMGFSFSFIGIVANIWAIIIPGFIFFAVLPYINSSIDVLIRKNISNEKQGRVWSLISVITYFGSIIAYSIAGFLADKIFNPLFLSGGAFANNLGHIFGIGPGRGIAFIFFMSGIFVMLLATIIFRSKSIYALDFTSHAKIYASKD